VTLPPSFAEGVDSIQLKQMGDYLVIRENEEQDGVSVQGLSIPADDLISLDEGKVKYPETIFEILPSWCIAGADQITIKKSEDDEINQMVDNLLKSAQERPFFEWDSTTFVANLKRYEYSDFVKDIGNFIDLHFMDILRDNVNIEYLSRDFDIENNLSASGFRNQSIITNSERELDIKWALAIKNEEGILDAQSISRILAANKLERIADHAYRCVSLIWESFKRDKPNTKAFIDSVHESFENPVEYHTQIEQIGQDAINGEIDMNDVSEIHEMSETRVLSLEDLRDFDGGNIIMGEIIGECYELARSPRSLAIAGAGGYFDPKAVSLSNNSI
jgi:hypothetical protein